MSVRDRQFQTVKWETLLDCLRWLQNRLELRDWEICLIEGSRTDEKECGSIYIDTPDAWKSRAELYLDIDCCQTENVSPVSTLCHEMIHVFVTGKCHLDSKTNLDEYIAYVFEDMLYQELCRAMKIKIAEFNP